MYKKVFLFVFLLLFATTASAVPVVVGVAIAIGAGAAGVAVGTAIAIGLAAASLTYALTQKLPNVSTRVSQQEAKQMIRSSRAPKGVIYGRTYVSGALLFVEEEQGDTANDEGVFEEDLYMAVGICDHAVTAVDRVDLNETNITQFGTKASYLLHNNDTVVDPVLLADAPSWMNDMIGRGTTWARLVLTYDRELYANGVPTPRFLVRGKQVWDPRDDTMKYSANAALVILDFFTEYMNIPRSRIITSGFGSFIDAANLCDELVDNPGDDTGSSRRYHINGRFNLDENPNSVLSDMLISCAGQLVRQAGNIGLLPGAYYGPATFTLTESDIIGDISVMPEPEYGDAANTIKGTFVDPDQNYVDTDFPPVVDANAKVRDRGELSHDLKFRFVTDVYQAQRVADITLKRGLAGGSISLTTNLRGMFCRLGRVIRVDFPTLGISGEYRVISQSTHISEGIHLELARDTANLYDDAIGSPFVSPPLTNIPVQGVRPPSAVAFTAEQIGEVVQGQITWRINDGQSASSDVRIKRSSDNVVVRNGSVTGNSFKLDGLPAANYLVEVRTVTTLGSVSAWVSATFVIALPPAPTSVTTNRSNWNIELLPQVTGGIPSGTLFEFRHIQDTESFVTGTPTYNAADVNAAGVVSVLTGSSLNQGGLTPDRFQHYWVRGTNPYGSSAWVYIRTGTTREQDLVTTVVERLVAIEIESQNFSLTGNTGYKLYSPDSDAVTLPDGTTLQNPDGLMVIGQAVLHNTLMVGDLENDAGLTIDRHGNIESGGYTAESAGYRIGADGNVEFNGGQFRGTVFVDSLVGDVVSAVAKVNTPRTVQTSGTSWVRGTTAFGTVQIVNGRNRARTLVVNLGLSVRFVLGEAFAQGAARIVATSTTFTDVTSREVTTPVKESDSGDNEWYFYSTVLSIPIAANQSGTITLHIETRKTTSTRSATIEGRISALTADDRWAAQLITNGGDLS